jgi:hypothetical protein
MKGNTVKYIMMFAGLVSELIVGMLCLMLIMGVGFAGGYMFQNNNNELLFQETSELLLDVSVRVDDLELELAILELDRDILLTTVSALEIENAALIGPSIFDDLPARTLASIQSGYASAKTSVVGLFEEEVTVETVIEDALAVYELTVDDVVEE